jgi:hypothetical protein
MRNVYGMFSSPLYCDKSATLCPRARKKDPGFLGLKRQFYALLRERQLIELCWSVI